jgi:hypothetical protein
MTKIYQAIEKINPNAKYTYLGEDIDSIEWKSDTTPIAKSDIQAKMEEIETTEASEKQAKEDLKASAKAKLIAGEALTEDEANTIVL